MEFLIFELNKKFNETSKCSKMNKINERNGGGDRWVLQGGVNFIPFNHSPFLPHFLLLIFQMKKNEPFVCNNSKQMNHRDEGGDRWVVATGYHFLYFLFIQMHLLTTYYWVAAAYIWSHFVVFFGKVILHSLCTWCLHVEVAYRLWWLYVCADRRL